MSAHQKALDKAKIQLMSQPDSAFFTSVCFSMKHIWDETIPTACTNGIEIRYSPQFFMEQSAEEQVFLLLHETLHVALQHMTRLNGRDPRKWNIAADYVINYMLVARGFKMPKGGLYDKQYAGYSADEVYDMLPEDPKEELPMDDLESPGSDADIADTQEKLDDILVRASIQSKMAGDAPGTIPGEIELYINSLLNPKLPWHAILRKWMTKLSKTDYTWRRPNRRFFPKHYLPSQYSQSLCDIAVAADISGSVTDDQFLQFASEVYAIIKKEQPDTLKFILFDTEIKSINDIKTAEDLKNVKFTGRGGTNIEPVIEWAKENKPHLLVIFTDGGFRNNLPDPRIPIVWVINDNPGYTARWGKTIHFDTH